MFLFKNPSVWFAFLATESMCVCGGWGCGGGGGGGEGSKKGYMRL